MTAPSTNLQGISSKMSVGTLPASIAYKKATRGSKNTYPVEWELENVFNESK